MLKIIAKSLLSLLAIGVFGVLGLVAAEMRPFDVPADIEKWRDTAGQSAPSARNAMHRLPSPPYTKQVMKNRTKKGTYIGYKSRLSIRGLEKFYTTRLPRDGWKENRVLGSMQKKVPSGGKLLSFRKGGSRCMIYFEPTAGFSTKVTVLHMDVDKFAPAKNRQN